MFKLILRLTLILRVVLSTHPPRYSEPANLLIWASCHYGDSIENSCNKCVCTSSGVYDCELQECQQAVQEADLKDEACQPNMIYNQDSTSCICTPEGKWPHTSCYDTFRHLPERAIRKQTCEPDGYIKIDCNICRCDATGQVDTTRCTTNECQQTTSEQKPQTRKQIDSASMFGTCNILNWYSLGPCQFCYCIEQNKLICGTSLKHLNRKRLVTLGSSQLVLCGPDLLREIAALVPESKSRYLRNGARSSSESEEKEESNDITQVSMYPRLDVQTSGEDEEENLKAEISEIKEQVKRYDKEADQRLRVVAEAKSKAKDKRLRLAAPLLMGDRADMDRSETEPPVQNYDPYAVLNNLIHSRRGLKLDKGTKCKPGTVFTVECNTCHCMKNGKRLCTDKKCN